VIVNDRLVYLRLQKCASTTISALLLDCVGGDRVQPSHRRLDFDPGSRVVFGSVRDPWSWYVSVWSFGCSGKGLSRRQTGSRPRRRAIGRTLVDELRGDRRSPSAALREFRANRRRPNDLYERLYSDVSDVGAFREWLALVHDPERAGDFNPNYFAGSLPHVAGLFTFDYLWLFSRDSEPIRTPSAFTDQSSLGAFDGEQNLCTAIVRTDRLGPELVEVLRTAGYDVAGGLADRVLAASSQRSNSSAHRSTRDYYDPASIDLVARRDAFLIAKHHFAPPN
jgi:hypothetical protein